MLKKITSIILTACLAFAFSIPVLAVATAGTTTLTVFAGGQGTTAFDITDYAGNMEDLTIDFVGANDELTKTIITPKGTGEILADNTFKFTARLDANTTGGVVTQNIDYRVVEGDNEPTTSTITVTINKSNIVAVNHEHAGMVQAGETVTGQLTKTGDLEAGGTLYFQILTDNDTEARDNPEGSPRGELMITTSGAYTYVSNATAMNDDLFYFIAGDSKGGSSVGSLKFSIQGAPTMMPSETSQPATMAPSPEPTATIPAFGYVDIHGSWVEPYADKEAYDNTLIGEKVGNKYYFQPKNMMTRGDFVVFINAALGLNPDDFKDETNPFADTIPEWLLGHAKAAYYSKIIDGVEWNGKKYFDGDEYLTRAQAVRMVYNAAKAKANVDTTGVVLSYRDIGAIPAWAYDAVRLLTKEGIVNGYDDNTFKPNAMLDRAASTKILSMAKTFIASIPMPSMSPEPSMSAIPSMTATPSMTAMPSATAAATLSGELYRVSE